MKKYFLSFFFCCCLLQAQGTYSVYQLTDSPAALDLNPANQIPAQFYFNIAGLSLLPSINFISSGNLLFSNNLATPFVNSANYQKAKANVFMQVNLDVFHFGFRIEKKHFLRYHVGMKAPVVFVLDRLLLDELYNANLSGSFLLADLYLSGYAYFQHVFGYTFVREKYNLGFNVKYLNIFAGLGVDKVNATLEVDSETGNVFFNGSATATVFYPKTSLLPSMVIYSGNYGFAWDFGFKVKVHPQVTLSASVIDLGFFSLNTSYIQSYQLNADVQFNIKPDNPSNIPFLNIYEHASHIINSFSQKFTSVTTNRVYQKISFLPLHVYAGVNYLMNEQHDLNFLLHLMTIPKLQNWRLFYDVGIGYVWRSPVFQPVINYHINTYSFFNLSLGFLMNIKAFQIHILTDNVLLSGGNTFIQLGAHWFFNRDSPAQRWGQ